MRFAATVLALALVGTAGCSKDGGGGPEGVADLGASRAPGARADIVDSLRLDLEVERHPADGGGRAWLVEEEGAVPSGVASQPGRWTVVYEAGPLGVEAGGWLYFQVSPFWGWSTPQTVEREAPGYTEVTTEAAGVTLEPVTLDQQLLGIEVGGRRLEAGERVSIAFGVGPLGAEADSYAEAASKFWIAVDGDGDGVRKLIDDSPAVPVLPGPPARLVLTLPSTAPADEAGTVRLTAAVLDARGNAGLPVTGALKLVVDPGGLLEPLELPFEAADGGVRQVEIALPPGGTWRLLATGTGDLEGLAAESNPLVVASSIERILWGDLHGHSAISDGTGSPEDYYHYARDVAALDVVALTDHDHWGMEPLSRHPELWNEIAEQNRRFHAPGEFVTLLGYEWTNWIHGHRHVLYFEDEGEVLSSVDPAYETPAQLWDALRGRSALTFAHHSAGGPVATNWEYPPDPELEPVTEVVSVHGSSEALDSPGTIYSPVPGNFVRDILDRGATLGFVGSGDGHDGHPGLSHLNAFSGGLAAILAEEATREAVLAALKARRVYATNGPRIVLDLRLGGRPMGAAISAADLAAGGESLSARIVATAPVESVDLIRGGEVVERILGDGEQEMGFERTIEGLAPGDYLYLRAVQVDGGAAWSSPYFIR